MCLHVRGRGCFASFCVHLCVGEVAPTTSEGAEFAVGDPRVRPRGV